MSAATGSASTATRPLRLDEEGLPFPEDLSSAGSAAASAAEVEARMGIVIVGHVDHGKSTIIGRLLADTGSLPEGKLEQIKDLCARTARPFEYAFLLDALKDERAQGITIDAARVFFRTPKRRCSCSTPVRGSRRTRAGTPICCRCWACDSSRSS